MERILRSNLDRFDFPFDAMAKAYVREADRQKRVGPILKFLNEKCEAQKQYLLLFAEDADVRATLNEYLEDTKSRWETFPVPVLGIKISRNEVAFYLCIVFAFAHAYYVVKHRYLLEMRERIPSLGFLPDPSLLSATPDDLAVLSKWLRWLIYVGQELFLLGLPLIMVALVFLFFKLKGRASLEDYTRTVAGIVVCLVEFAFALWTQCSHWRKKQAAWAKLFH